MHTEVAVYSVNRDPVDPAALQVLLSAVPEAGARLGYGGGLDPYCNLVDEADMPLCAFLPQEIERKAGGAP